MDITYHTIISHLPFQVNSPVQVPAASYRPVLCSRAAPSVFVHLRSFSSVVVECTHYSSFFRNAESLDKAGSIKAPIYIYVFGVYRVGLQKRSQLSIYVCDGPLDPRQNATRKVADAVRSIVHMLWCVSPPLE